MTGSMNTRLPGGPHSPARDGRSPDHSTTTAQPSPGTMPQDDRISGYSHSARVATAGQPGSLRPRQAAVLRPAVVWVDAPARPGRAVRAAARQDVPGRTARPRPGRPHRPVRLPDLDLAGEKADLLHHLVAEAIGPTPHRSWCCAACGGVITALHPSPVGSERVIGEQEVVYRSSCSGCRGSFRGRVWIRRIRWSNIAAVHGALPGIVRWRDFRIRERGLQAAHEHRGQLFRSPGWQPAGRVHRQWPAAEQRRY